MFDPNQLDGSQPLSHQAYGMNSVDHHVWAMPRVVSSRWNILTQKKTSFFKPFYFKCFVLKLKFVSSKCFDIIQSFQLCQTLAEKACKKTTQSENSFSAQIYLASYQNLNPEGSETPTTTEWEVAAGSNPNGWKSGPNTQPDFHPAKPQNQFLRGEGSQS